jgi:hypothetical protein
MKSDNPIPDKDSNGKLTLSVSSTLGAGEEIELTARDDDDDFECPRNQPLSFFSELPPLGMALQTVLTREGSGL